MNIKLGHPVSDRTINRLAIFCGPIGQLCFVLFLPAGLMLPPISPSLSPEETANHYRKNEAGMKAGATIMLLSGIFWPIFCAGVNRQLARIPNINPTLLWAQLAAGSLGAVSMMLPAIFFAATVYRLDRDPVLTQLLSDLAWFCFALLFPPFVAQDMAISCAILSDTRSKPLLPRWLAYTTTGLTLTLYPALGVHCVQNGPIAWNGAVGFWLGAAGFGIQVGLLVSSLLKAVATPDNDDGSEEEG
ncbi:hypothetical protein N7471_011906 [Penicillium samsonianum]|uniref:uncharacterized protein n=1 Tax=Penicillium samsonianum TaxID=1882272 RepID=UPI002548F437|nr:uncharacterized protein N7471_011906 [Penicillium samsonianum]KAJ6124589.1 hypothetical protein N7471_011906 [Penicillium samsonianum]